MSKKKILIPLIIFSTILTTGSVYTYQMLYSPNFLINAEDKFIIIEENTDFNELIKKLEDDTLINDILSFSFLSKLMEYQENIKIGAYKVKMNMSNYEMITMLRSGNQTPIKLTFTYARKIEDLAEKITTKLKMSKDDLLNYLNENINNYIEETIYNKFEENVYLHQLAFETRFRQPWGEIYTNLRAKSFLQDPSKNSFRFDSWFSIRVFEGLAVRFGGEIELIRDQLSLPKGNASIEDLLLQQQEIATDFRSEFRIAIGYTFGSAFNNYLNSRL